MKIIKKILNFIFITIGGLISVCLALLNGFILVNIVIKFFVYFDLYQYAMVIGYFILLITIFGIAWYSLDSFLEWLDNKFKK